MSYGESTANVGVREEVESHIDLILREVGEIVNLAHRRGGDAKGGQTIRGVQANLAQVTGGVGGTIILGDMPTWGYQQVEDFPLITNKN